MSVYASDNQDSPQDLINSKTTFLPYVLIFVLVSRAVVLKVCSLTSTISWEIARCVNSELQLGFQASVHIRIT